MSRKTLNQVAGVTGDFGSSVRITGVNRELDRICRRQLRTETRALPMPTSASTFLYQLQTVYGNPGSTGTLEDAFNKLTTAVQALSTSSDSQSARIGVVNAAQALAQQLNTTTQGIQTLRANAETGIERLRQRRQQRDEADREDQQPACRATAGPTRRRPRCSTSATSTSTSCRS